MKYAKYIHVIYCDTLPYLQQLVSSAREKKVGGRYAKLDNEMERGNQDYIDQQRHQQQVGERERGGEGGREGGREGGGGGLPTLCANSSHDQFPRGNDVQNSF